MVVLKIQDRFVLGVCGAVTAFSVSVYVILSGYYGPPSWNMLSMPVAGFLIYLLFNLAFGTLAIIWYVLANTRDTEGNPWKRRLASNLYMLFPTAVVSINDFLYYIGFQSSSFRTGPSPFSNHIFLYLWIIPFCLLISLVILNLIEKRSLGQNTGKRPFQVRKKAIVVVATAVMLMSMSLVTYAATPFFLNQHIVPNGEANYFELNGGYGDSFLSVTREGYLHVNIESTANMTVYVLDSSQFSALVNLTPPQAYPPPLNFTLSNYMYSSGTVNSANFIIHLEPGSYTVVYFNRGYYGTTITINSLIFTPN